MAIRVQIPATALLFDVYLGSTVGLLVVSLESFLTDLVCL